MINVFAKAKVIRTVLSIFPKIFKSLINRAKKVYEE